MRFSTEIGANQEGQFVQCFNAAIIECRGAKVVPHRVVRIAKMRDSLRSRGKRISLRNYLHDSCEDLEKIVVLKASLAFRENVEKGFRVNPSCDQGI